MKKTFYVLIGVILVGFCAYIPQAFATVGGPTYVYDIRSGTSGIIYTEQNSGGKGCPPTIQKIDPATGKISTLVSCDEGLNGEASYQKKFGDTLAKFPIPLKHISLRYNFISAKITATREVKEDYENNIFGRTDFRADIFQGDKKLTTITYSGCKSDQAHIIEGYSTPDDKSTVLVISTVSDCFEGGYIGERLYVVPGVTISYSYPMKIRDANTAATADVAGSNGNLLVFANDSKGVTPTVTQASTVTPEEIGQSEPNRDFKYQITIGLLVLISVLLAVGYKKR